MHSDYRGFQITSSDEVAAHACAAATESFIRRQTDTIPLLQKSLSLEPTNAFTQAVFGLMLHGARKRALYPDILSALQVAKDNAASITSREKYYIEALQYACDGDLFAMIRSYEKVLQECPTDILALSLAQGELFWLGEMQHSMRLSQMVRPQWNESIEGFPEYLAVLAFDLEEACEYTEAEDIGRQSVALRKTNAWGTHAVAHALYMQGRHSDGVDWLTPKQNNWDQINQIKYHIWWHQCLFHLESSERDVVLEHYDRWVRNHDEELVRVTPDLYIDMQNGASMLWRLEQQGVDVGDRWQELATLTETRLNDMSSPFTSAHYAVILAATGQAELCDALLREMDEFSRTEHTLATRYREAAIPAAIAAIEHRKGNHQRVIDTLLPFRQHLWQMGGSHAQQDLFHQMLVDSAQKVGDNSLLATLIMEIEALGFTAPMEFIGYRQTKDILDN